MTTISIIGSGNKATAVGTRAAKHGHTIELMSRNTAKAQALADQIGNGATAGERPQPAALQGLRLGQATCSRIPVRDPHWDDNDHGRRGHRISRLRVDCRCACETPTTGASAHCPRALA